MVLLRSGKKTRIDAPKIPSDNKDRTLLDFNTAASDEEKHTPVVQPKPRTPRRTGKKLSNQADVKAKVETPRRTPRKATTKKHSEPTKQVSGAKTKAAEASSSKSGSSSTGPGPSKSVFLKSGAGEVRRKRLSEEKNRARKLSEGKDSESSRSTPKVQTVPKNTESAENAENAEDEDHFAIDLDSLIVGPTIQVSLYRLLNSKPAAETSDFYNAGDEAAILNSKKNRNNKIKMEFHQIDWSDDESEEWSDSESESGSSYHIREERADSDKLGFGSSPTAAESPAYENEDILATQKCDEEKLVDTGASSSRVSVWWEPDDGLKGGFDVIDGTSSTQAYSREANEGSRVSPSSASSSASASSWHTAMGSVSTSTAFHSTNRRYAEEHDDKLLRR